MKCPPSTIGMFFWSYLLFLYLLYFKYHLVWSTNISVCQCCPTGFIPDLFKIIQRQNKILTYLLQQGSSITPHSVLKCQRIMCQLPRVVITSCRKLIGLKQQKFILSEVLETRSLIKRCQQRHTPSEVLWENVFLPLVASGVSWSPLAWGITPQCSLLRISK